VHEVIPLLRARAILPKRIALYELARRFACAEKGPPKHAELRRTERATSRVAGRERDPLAGIPLAKYAPRVRRVAKLRLFRVWKLFQELKALQPPPSYRPIAERLRSLRGRRRL
jgi:hypothetical protein